MARPNNGGPAFPGSVDEGVDIVSDPDYDTDGEAAVWRGMSLRDWFATHAPKPPEGADEQLGFKWNPPENEAAKAGGTPAEILCDAGIEAYRFAYGLKAGTAWAYAWADAMIEARKATDAAS